MKKYFLNFCLKKIVTDEPSINKVELEELQYGLEIIYSIVTKSIFIFSIAFILRIFTETLLLLIFFNILRTTGFGLHATKSWICLLSSSVIFIFLPFLSKVISIPFVFKLLLGGLAIILLYIYSPSDTFKRPIVSPRLRNKYKFITTINSILLVYFAVFISNNTISNLLLFGIYIEVILILPITYNIFHLSYNNYLNYKFD